MKVLIAIPYLAAVYGGPSKVAQDLAQSLGQKGISVDLVTTNANGADKLTVPLNQWIEKKDYRVKYFDCFHRYDFIMSVALCQWLARYAADYAVVHTHNMFAPTMAIARWICQQQKVPYLTTPHGMLEPWALSYKASKKRLYYRYFESPMLRTSSAIHVLNRQEASHVNTLGFSQTEIIHNGIYRSEFQTLPKPEVFYHQFPETQGKQIVLFLGRIDPKKGLDLLAPAFAKARHQFPNAHLVLAGPDSIGFLPTARSFFEQVGCSNAVTFTGMLTGDLKYSALAAASVYVAPSYSEGFSISILEGMAAGLPCIITHQCNFPEAATMEAAHIVDSDAEAIYSALSQVLGNLSEGRAMGQRARNLVLQHYTWGCAAEKLIGLYKAIGNVPTQFVNLNNAA
ncbi:glycosyltransferase [cf. Phormidesmis sp. LEGE 11477]|uniref:glycosyltransferase n=1 Tax=cf. Phormidesmis sp. LEGE 11477 TaxID=1828680 RepID=UPI00187F328F|nr:glycosyltransferase [cf. Phormidesmis sp. LEGE 11477]MBE9060260.1 glycosyltransferase [cf. Phormidesmis sp. LEGE 11477]